MNLGDLLSELRENILHDRSDRIAASDNDYLWSDATLVRYINDAQRRFARKSLVIRDSRTADCCELTLVEGQSEYDCHPSVLAVISARLEDERVDMTRSGHDDLNAYAPADTTFWDTNALSVLDPGKPLAFTTDETVTVDNFDTMSTIVVKVYPAPSADYAGKKLYLRVCRLPLEELKLASLKQVPEVPEDYHLDMLDWAAYLALRIVDVDAGMPARAAEFRASFDVHVAEARKETLKKVFAPLTWGRGRNGFVWER